MLTSEKPTFPQRTTPYGAPDAAAGLPDLPGHTGAAPQMAPPMQQQMWGAGMMGIQPGITQGERTVVGGIAFDNVTMADAVTRIGMMVQKADHPCMVCTGNLDHLVMLQQDAEFRAIYAESELVLADGMPVVWLSRLAHWRQAAVPALRERVAGSDLFWELGRASALMGLRLFFLGGAPGAAERAAEVMQQRYPGAEICGIYCPPFDTFETPEEQERIRVRIREAQPDILLVGFGAPKQEKWIAANRYRLGVPVSIGVGGSFDMAAGVFKRAPKWIQRLGMEWLYRMAQDPGRLGKRYLGRDLPYLFTLLFQTLRGNSGGKPATGHPAS